MAEPLTGRQSGALLLGVVAPALLLAARLSPESALAGAAAALAMTGLLYSLKTLWTLGLAPAMLTGFGPLGVSLVVGYLLWVVVTLSAAARLSAECFPLESSWPWIPAVLMALAALALRRGTGVAARCAGVLWPLLLVVPALTLVCAGADGSFAPPEPNLGQWERGASLLLPGVLASLSLPARPESRRWVLPMTAAAALLAAFCALVARASLGTHLQPRLTEPFYEMVRSVSLFGFSERLESLVSAVLTAGFFLVFCLFGALGSQLLSALAPRLRAGAVWVLGAGLLVSGWIPQVPENFFTWLTAIFCAVIPLVTQALVKWRQRAKNCKKS